MSINQDMWHVLSGCCMSSMCVACPQWLLHVFNVCGMSSVGVVSPQWGHHEILNVGTLKISNHENTKGEVVPVKAGPRNPEWN